MKQILLLFMLGIQSLVFAQATYTIQGHFPNFPNSQYELKGYYGLEQITIATAKSKEDGKFTLSYPATYVGNAQLYMNGAYQNLFLLNKENIHIFWEDLTKREGMQITGSAEYDAFLKGMKTFQDSEAKLGGLNYLLPLYKTDSIKQLLFAKELDTVTNAFPAYIKALSDSLYVRQFLLAKGLIEQMPKTVETYKWRAPAHVAEFMAIDFKALKHAGLYKDLIEGYTNLAERFPLVEVNLLLTEAINKVVTELKDQSSTLQEISLQWFTLLETKSLFDAAAHLAQTMLKQNTVLDAKSVGLYKKYEALAIGNTAPNIQLTKKKTLRNINNTILLVFGSSKVGHCMDAKKELEAYYPKWRAKGNIEVVYISLDTDIEVYNKAFGNTPWQTYCDYKGWETQAAKDYYINATPTYFLLDKDMKILVHPRSLGQVAAWVHHKL